MSIPSLVTIEGLLLLSSPDIGVNTICDDWCINCRETPRDDLGTLRDGLRTPLCDDFGNPCDNVGTLCDDLVTLCDDLVTLCDDLETLCDDLWILCDDLGTTCDGWDFTCNDGGIPSDCWGVTCDTWVISCDGSGSTICTIVYPHYQHGL